MTELEQRLTNELSKLAGQYAEDQKRLARAPPKSHGRTGPTRTGPQNYGQYGFQLQSAGARPRNYSERDRDQKGRTQHGN